MRAKLRGDIVQQPLPLDDPIGQVRPNVCEPKLDHPGGDPLLGVPASLQGQAAGPGWQHDAHGGERLGDGPLADAEFLREPWDAVPGVAASLKVATQVAEPEVVGAPLQPPDAAVIDHKPAPDDQLTGCSAGTAVTHAFVVPGATQAG
jgi:hypothetical protein